MPTAARPIRRLRCRSHAATSHRPTGVAASLASAVLALSVLGTMQAASAATNLALTGTASQSSTYPSGDAWQAIGDRVNHPVKS